MKKMWVLVLLLQRVTSRSQEKCLSECQAKCGNEDCIGCEEPYCPSVCPDSLCDDEPYGIPWEPPRYPAGTYKFCNFLARAALGPRFDPRAKPPDWLNRECGNDGGGSQQCRLAPPERAGNTPADDWKQWNHAEGNSCYQDWDRFECYNRCMNWCEDACKCTWSYYSRQHRCEYRFTHQWTCACANVCTCQHGVPVSNGNCTFHGANICRACHPFFHLDQHANCKANICKCDHGTAVSWAECLTHGVHECVACDKGYHLGELPECIVNVCSCANGTPQSPGECLEHSTTDCSACNEGYHPVSGVQGQQRCEVNVCMCENGTPHSADACLQHNATECATCNKGYHAVSDGQGKQRCEANVCLCENGIPHSVGACSEHKASECATCNHGYRPTSNSEGKRRCERFDVITFAGYVRPNTTLGSAYISGFANPGAIEIVSPNYALYVADKSGVHHLQSKGFVTTFFMNTTGCRGLAVGQKSNVYVTDGEKHNILAVHTDTRRVFHVAGNGLPGFRNGNALDAQFNAPAGIAFNSRTGGLYVADANNHCIRLISGNEVTTAAGSCTNSGFRDGTVHEARFNYPLGIVRDFSTGEVFVCDSQNHRIRVILRGVVSTFLGNGAQGYQEGDAEEVMFNHPSGIALGRQIRSGRSFGIIDSFGQRLRLMSQKGTETLIPWIVDSNTARRQRTTPLGIAFIPDISLFNHFYVADPLNHRILHFQMRQKISNRINRAFLDGPQHFAAFDRPKGIAVLRGSAIYITDYKGVRLISPNGTVSTLFENRACASVAIDTDGNAIVSNELAHDIQLVNIQTGRASRVAGQGSPGFLNGNALFALFNFTTVVLQGGTRLLSPAGIALDIETRSIYVADTGNHCIRLISGEQVTTVAGSCMNSGFRDAAVHEAMFYEPSGIALGRAGDIYVSDFKNHCIRRIRTSISFVDTFAGNGMSGFQDGYAKEAMFNFPTGIALDSSGVIYVIDNFGTRVRYVVPTRAVSTLTGGGLPGFLDCNAAHAEFALALGVAVSPNGDIYVTDAGNHRIRRIQVTLKACQCTNGILHTVDACSQHDTTECSMCNDDYHLARTNQEKPCCERSDVSTFAGHVEPEVAFRNGYLAELENPGGIEVGPDNTVYVANKKGIRLVAPNGYVKTFFMNTTGCKDLALDRNGNAYVTDGEKHSVFFVNITTGRVSRVAGNGLPGFRNGNSMDAQFNAPAGIALNIRTGRIYIADANNHCIRLILGNQVATEAGSCTNSGFRDAPVDEARFNYPLGIALGDHSGIYVCDSKNHRIRSVMFGLVRTFLGSGTRGFRDGNAREVMFNHPSGIAVLKATKERGIFLGIVDSFGTRLRGMRKTGTDIPVPWVVDSNAAGSQVSTPLGIAFASNDQTFPEVYVADSRNDRILRIEPELYLRHFISSRPNKLEDPSLLRFSSPVGIAVQPGGAIYVSDINAVRLIAPNRTVSSVFQKSYCVAIAIDMDGNVLCSDEKNNNIDVLNIQTGFVSRAAGNGRAGCRNGEALSAKFNFRSLLKNEDLFWIPAGIALDIKTGSIYVADVCNHCIRLIFGERVITAAGSCRNPGLRDAAIHEAKFSKPSGIVLGRAGDIYVSDALNHCIRRIRRSVDLVETLAGSGTSGFQDGYAKEAMFNFPTGIATDSSGTIYVSDNAGTRIRYVLPTGAVSTLTGTGLPGFLNGKAAHAQFALVLGVAVGPNGDVYVADSLNHRIRRIRVTRRDELVKNDTTMPNRL